MTVWTKRHGLGLNPSLKCFGVVLTGCCLFTTSFLIPGCGCLYGFDCGEEGTDDKLDWGRGGGGGVGVLLPLVGQLNFKVSFSFGRLASEEEDDVLMSASLFARQKS